MRLNFRCLAISLPEWVSIEVPATTTLEGVWRALMQKGVSRPPTYVIGSGYEQLSADRDLSAQDLALMPDLTILEGKTSNTILLTFNVLPTSYIGLNLDKNITNLEVYRTLHRLDYDKPMLILGQRTIPATGDSFSFAVAARESVRKVEETGRRLVRLRPDNEARILKLGSEETVDQLYDVLELTYPDHRIVRLTGEFLPGSDSTKDNIPPSLVLPLVKITPYPPIAASSSVTAPSVFTLEQIRQARAEGEREIAEIRSRIAEHEASLAQLRAELEGSLEALGMVKYQEVEASQRY